MRSLSVLLLWFLSANHLLQGAEMRRSDSVLLNGDWEYVVGEASVAAHTKSARDTLNWSPVQLPGRFTEWNGEVAASVRFVWVRRAFQVSASQARRLAVLRWNRIDYGATAFINGRQVGHNEPTGPYCVCLAPGTLQTGTNEIVLKIPGAAGVRRSKSGQFLFPAGLIWGPARPRWPAVTDDIWIDFANHTYMKWVLAIPDMAESRVRIRVTFAGVERLAGLRLVAQVRPWPEGEVIGAGDSVARCTPSSDPLGGEHFFVEVAMPDFKVWTPEQCNLYAATVELQRESEVLDHVTIRFGMREIKVVNSDYRLNGQRLMLHGSNLVHEWDWGDMITGKEHAYLVEEAHEMNINAFRTHTQPPPKLWADICDENGTLILAEFPMLYNYRNPHFTPGEWKEFHRNALRDTAAWMARLWNHPAVIMWVLSNESRDDNQWESGPFRDFVVGLDPTRPTMRTGTTGTATNYDVHTCGNTNHWTHEGQMHLVVDDWFRQAGNRTVTNSEYMNVFNRPKCQWTGSDDEEADRLAYAQLGMEHTEVMRRARVDAILPYMYAGWTRTRRGETWKGGYAQPVSAAWHSALSPVLASLDLFDANYLTGQQLTTDLYLINDSWHNAAIHVDLMLTRECPEFIPEAECFERPLAKWSFDFDLDADSLRKEVVKWELPKATGTYWLTARTTGLAGRPVLSQRFVRAVQSSEISDRFRSTKFVILGDDDTRRSWFRANGLVESSMPTELSPREHVVVVWNTPKLSEADRKSAAKICRFAAEGGRVVVLSTKAWDWPELSDVKVDRVSGSRVFPYAGMATHPLLNGVDLECLKRWNGLPGTVAAASLAGSVVESGRRILWVREPKHAVVAEVSSATGDGRVLFSQLDLRGHVLRSAPNYDPVAEQILINLLAP